MSLSKVKDSINKCDVNIQKLTEKLESYNVDIQSYEDALNDSLLKHLNEEVLTRLNEEADIFGLHIAPSPDITHYSNIRLDVKVDGEDRTVATIELGTAAYGPVRVCEETKRPFVYKLASSELLEKVGSPFTGEIMQGTEYRRNAIYNTDEVINYSGKSEMLFAKGYHKDDDNVEDEERGKRYVKSFITDLQAEKFRAPRPYFQTLIWSQKNRVEIVQYADNTFMGLGSHNGSNKYTSKMSDLVNYFGVIEEGVLAAYSFHVSKTLEQFVEELHETKVLKAHCEREIKELEMLNESYTDLRVVSLREEFERLMNSEEGWDVPKWYLTLEEADEKYDFESSKQKLMKVRRSNWNGHLGRIMDLLPYMDYNEGFNLKLVRTTSSGKSIELELTQHGETRKSKLIKSKDWFWYIDQLAKEVVEHEIINQRQDFFEVEEEVC